ncbi:Methyltransferase domain-containing protein [Chitinophaga terrae (ex Kim and Jung 2007)]|uniref:Methyltransferase domain-containing protein n=1 Tax=Chitinophaga terrae (ex Kim and Jung 2007) TaxID=408074 RepID=A0A1H3XWM5_9BACT|nr:class I SAM-dependent methyltransferase [Chitinophaga terrae (ex Kim and Jung 2007)]GEP89437.1 hypothetical protein CTE07_10820 [Chitinophaga terrae (ex Kim and Jung 2007)]SEA03723.1 Methyltransferase domain-containing protein [Chitinophaga terrae (ex Kim and Jung 2007)]
MKSWDPIWDNVFLNQEWGKYPSESVIQFIARNFYKKDRKAIKILEVGCGTGANIWFISREGFQTYGIDGSSVAIDVATKRLAAEGLTSNLICGDISSLPYETETFDAVIDVECLYANNRTSTERILEEIKRVLKRNGKFFSRTFSDKMYLGQFYEELTALEYTNSSDGPLAGKGFTRLSNRESIREIYGAVFNIESVDTLDYTSHDGGVTISEFIIVASK